MLSLDLITPVKFRTHSLKYNYGEWGESLTISF